MRAILQAIIIFAVSDILFGALVELFVLFEIWTIVW